jgi:hypothetical protein
MQSKIQDLKNIFFFKNQNSTLKPTCEVGSVCRAHFRLKEQPVYKNKSQLICATPPLPLARIIESTV